MSNFPTLRLRERETVLYNHLLNQCCAASTAVISQNTREKDVKRSDQKAVAPSVAKELFEQAGLPVTTLQTILQLSGAEDEAITPQQVSSHFPCFPQ